MMLLKCCTLHYQQIWKTQQWPQDWKRSIFILISKNGSTKECSNHKTVALISCAVGLPDPGIKLESPALHVDYLPVSHWGIVNHSPKIIYGMSNYIVDFKSYIPLQLHLFVFYHLFRAKLTCLFFYRDFLVPFNYNYIHVFSTVLILRWVGLKMFFNKR